MRYFALIVATVGLAFVASPAQAATRPANCGTKWIKSGPGPREAKVRVTTWWVAPDVHKNIPCRAAWSDARRIVGHGTFPQSMAGWMYEKDGNSGPGSWVQFYGGHGLHLRIRYLDERGYSPDDYA